MTRFPNKITLEASYIEVQNPHPPVTEDGAIDGVVNTYHFSHYPNYTFSIRFYKDSPGSAHERLEPVLEIETTFVPDQKEGENEIDVGAQEDDEPSNYDLLFQTLHEASMQYWIADAIRNGKSVGAAFGEADRIDSALHPDAPHIDIESSYGAEAWKHWQAYKEAWEKSHPDVEAYRKAKRAEWEVEHKARQAAFKAAFGILARELRVCCREEHPHETDD